MKFKFFNRFPLKYSKSLQLSLFLVPSSILVSLKSKSILSNYNSYLGHKFNLYCDSQSDVVSDIPIVVQDVQIPTRILSSEIIRHLKPHSLLLSSIILVTTLSALVNISTPVLIGDIVTILQTSSDFSVLNIPALKLFILFVAQGVVTFIDIALVSRLGELLAKSLKKELYTSLLNQDIEFYDANMQGQISSRLTQDISDFKHTFKQLLTQGLKCAIQAIGSVFHLFRISSSLTTILISTFPMLYISMNIYGIYLRNLSRSAKQGDSTANGIAGEVLSNIKTVRAFASEDRELSRFIQYNETSSSLNQTRDLHIGAFQGITNTSIGCMILLILYNGGKMVQSQRMTGGELMTYLVATQQAQRSLSLVGVLFGQVVKAFSSASRIFEYIHSKPTINSDSGVISTIKGKIEFKNICFSYPTRPNYQVLKNFSLDIPIGSVIALCGSSGSGKSTIGQLMERFYDARSGSLEIDNVPIQFLNLKWLRSQIGYINQEPVLFSTSILENIRYGNQNASINEIHEAAKQANCFDFITSFPDGFETVVGERGVTLSGGQKQRIAIARAILKSPKILILDESTSALDSVSEKLVQEALDRLMKGRTTLVIAHRLSTIKNADLIVVMNSVEGRDGNILEMGKHDDLIKKKGVYYSLYNQKS